MASVRPSSVARRMASQYSSSVLELAVLDPAGERIQLRIRVSPEMRISAAGLVALPGRVPLGDDVVPVLAGVSSAPALGVDVPLVAGRVILVRHLDAFCPVPFKPFHPDARLFNLVRDVSAFLQSAVGLVHPDEDLHREVRAVPLPELLSFDELPLESGKPCRFLQRGGDVLDGLFFVSCRRHSGASPG